MQARLGALQEQLASARSAPAKQTIVALQTSRPATWMGYVEKNRRLVRAARVLLRLQHRRLATAWAMWEAQWHEEKRIRHAAVLRRRQNPALALVSGAGRWRDVRLKSSRMAWSRGGRLRAAAPEEHMQGVRASASTSAKGAHARSAGAASTSAKEQRQGVRASASTSASGAHARR